MNYPTINNRKFQNQDSYEGWCTYSKCLTEVERREMVNILETIEYRIQKGEINDGLNPLAVRDFIQKWGKETLKWMVAFDFIELTRTKWQSPWLPCFPLSCHLGDEGRLALQDLQEQYANDSNQS